MPAIIQIDQVGLVPAGTPGKSRSDGLLTGALVTITSTGGGTTHALNLLWIPDGDQGTPASFLNPTPTTWTFAPTVNSPGTYRIELDVDGDVQVRELRMRTSLLGLILGAMNETGDPAATLLNQGAPVIAASEDNEDELTMPPALSGLEQSAAPSPFLGGNFGAWYRKLRDMAIQIEDRAAGLFPAGFQNPDNGLTNPDTVLTYASAGGTLSVAPSATFWDHFYQGLRRRVESNLLSAGMGVGGLFLLFVGADGTLQIEGPMGGAGDAGDVLGVFTDQVPVAWVVVESGGVLALMIDARHGLSMTPGEKTLIQLGLGGLWNEGLLPINFTLGDGSLDAHAIFGLDDGVVAALDLQREVADASPGSEPQALRPTVEVLRWLFRAAPGVWARAAGNVSFPINALGATPGHNANGTSLAIPANGEFVLATYFAAPTLPGTPGGASAHEGDQLFAIAGQAVFAGLAAAQAAAARVLLDLDLDGLPNSMTPICTVIIQKDTGFANAADSRIVATSDGSAFVDHRRIRRGGVFGGGGGGGATTWLALTDTPASYAGTAEQLTGPNTGETAIEGKPQTRVTAEDTLRIQNGGVFIGANDPGNRGGASSGLAIVAVGDAALAAATTGTDLIAIGSNAGAAVTSSQKHVLIGSRAGVEITTDALEGNVYIGYEAGEFVAGAAESESQKNVAIGTQALQGTATGQTGIIFTVAIGYRAMQNVATGAIANVAVGHQAGVSISTGDHNTLAGDLAGDGITTGSRNVVIGAAMAVSAAADDDVIAIGSLAPSNAGQLVVVDPDLGGVFIGASTPGNWPTLTGVDNTIVGDAAGTALTSGTRNVMVGANAGLGVTTGVDNVFLGQDAGDGMSADTNGVILIGRNVAAPGGVTADNEVNVGNVFMGNRAGGQNARIGGSGSLVTDASLELPSTVGALLLNRLTTTQRDALTPVDGMLLYNSTTNTFQGYENGTWTNFI